MLQFGGVGEQGPAAIPLSLGLGGVSSSLSSPGHVGQSSQKARSGPRPAPGLPADPSLCSATPPLVSGSRGAASRSAQVHTPLALLSPAAPRLPVGPSLRWAPAKATTTCSLPGSLVFCACPLPCPVPCLPAETGDEVH